MTGSNDEDDYKVGYKSPPKHTQFQKGVSGNPKGRPSGTLNLSTDLHEELSQRVSVTENGQTATVSKQRLLIKTLFSREAKGDTRSAGLLIKLIQTTGTASESHEDDPLSPEDEAILEGFLKKANMTGGPDHAT